MHIKLLSHNKKITTKNVNGTVNYYFWQKRNFPMTMILRCQILFHIFVRTPLFTTLTSPINLKVRQELPPPLREARLQCTHATVEGRYFSSAKVKRRYFIAAVKQCGAVRLTGATKGPPPPSPLRIFYVGKGKFINARWRNFFRSFRGFGSFFARLHPGLGVLCKKRLC